MLTPIGIYRKHIAASLCFIFHIVNWKIQYAA